MNIEHEGISNIEQGISNIERRFRSGLGGWTAEFIPPTKKIYKLLIYSSLCFF